MSERGMKSRNYEQEVYEKVEIVSEMGYEKVEIMSERGMKK